MTFVGLGSGSLVSSQVTLTYADRGFAVFVPAVTATTIFVQFAQSSGGTFHDLARPDGSGVPFVVYSGSAPGVGYVAQPVTPWVRFRLSVPTASLRAFPC